MDKDIKEGNYYDTCSERQVILTITKNGYTISCDNFYKEVDENYINTYLISEIELDELSDLLFED